LSATQTNIYSVGESWCSYQQSLFGIATSLWFVQALIRSKTNTTNR